MREDDLLSLEKRTSRISNIETKNVQKRNESAVMFISAFFVMLLLFLGIAKQISPDVDVSIGNANQLSEDTTENYAKSLIDDRLRLIQKDDEDSVNATGESIFDDSLEERVVLPDNVKRKNAVEYGTIPNDPLPTFQAQKEALINNIETQTLDENNVETTQTLEKTVPVTINAKVTVGHYVTAAQAQVAKEILQEAGLNINPFVKQIGNYYTIQAGSYSSMEKAKSVANELLKNNFPAEIVME